MPGERYGIAEWFGEPLLALTPARRAQLARSALQRGNAPRCPFQQGDVQCSKKGGVCSIQRYEEADSGGRIAAAVGEPVVVCPRRFQESQVLIRWLAEIVGIDADNTYVAREVPFMRGTRTGKPAGKIDLVIAGPEEPSLRSAGRWYGLEIQAVYFSGEGMTSEFERMLDDNRAAPPFPGRVRRPDWRSSSAKRLMPQLEIKVPTLRRWSSKVAVAVDKPFFESMGGPSPNASRDLDDGDIIWLAPELQRSDDHSIRMTRGHFEVLTLEDSRPRLLAAETISRGEFEETLRRKLEPLG